VEANILSDAESAAVERAVRVASQFRKVVQPSRKRHRTGPLLHSQVHNLLVRASAAAAETFGMRVAQEWAAGFVFATEVHTRDASHFAQVGFDIGAITQYEVKYGDPFLSCTFIHAQCESSQLF
jgi:hypothetical protein